jgi:Tfp pilus assembly protein PilF
MQKLGSTLRRSGQNAEPAEVLKRAVSIAPDNASTWHELGLTYRALSKLPDPVAALEKACKLDPDMSETQNNLGIILFAGGEQARTESAFREAIRIQPDYTDAHGNLGTLLLEPAISLRRAITLKSRFVCGQTMQPPDTTMPCALARRSRSRRC